MHELIEEALVAASVDVVWADLTDATALAEWFWPAALKPTATVEPHRGGVFVVRSQPAGRVLEAEVLAVQRPRTLRLAWRWAGQEHSTDVEITLERATAATRVILRHSGFVDADERASQLQDWSHRLQRLVDRHGGSPGAGVGG